MIGRNCRSPRDGHKVPICRKVLVAALSLSLITGSVPAPAWAQSVEDAQDVLAQAAAAAQEPRADVDAAVAAGGLAAGEGHEEATAPAASADDRSARAGLDADYIYIHDKNGSDPRKIGVGQELRIDAT